MRLLELEIHNMRGVRHVVLEPDGDNFVIWGPNGSGKSAVVDALDFLLTGRISRLTGRGTSGITLNHHGPHIDRKPKDARVRAKIKISGIPDPVEIERCMANTNMLVCQKSVRPQVERIMDVAQRGQHVLTRREILKFITTVPSTRGRQIQQILDLTEIEDIRKSLVRVHNQASKAHKVAKEQLEAAKSTIAATTQAEEFTRQAALAVVNQNRAALEAPPASTLHSSQLKDGLTIPALQVEREPQSINLTILERDIQHLRSKLSEAKQADIASTDQQLRQLLSAIRSQPELLRALTRRQLTEIGLRLMDESGNCPLCDTPWPAGELHRYLEQQLSMADEAVQNQKRIEELSGGLLDAANNTIASVGKVTQAAEIAANEDDVQLLKSWLSYLQRFTEALGIPLEKYPRPYFPTQQVQRMLAPIALEETLERAYVACKDRFPDTPPEQTAWDTLTRLEENLKVLEQGKEVLETARAVHSRAKLLLETFEGARDSVLENLYRDIEVRFTDLYREIHGPDEDGFTARLTPKGAGLDLEVDFYGRGTHPPHALHSEGHQDSMGLCLYLALAEYLTHDLIDLIILDGVVMSVDADHRRQVCRILATAFPDRQFFITTHDRTWARQLRSAGVVTSRRTYEFFNWRIETGPQVNHQVDMWDRIAEDLDRNDVPSAAHRLRRGSEQFFGSVCDALQARVPYKLDGRWELGHFLYAAMGQYRELLKQAKRAAQSWRNRDQLEKLNELDSTVGQIYQRTHAEQWAVNVNVHYNSWANFSKNDFRPVAEAFQDLYSLFACNNCGAMLRVVTEGHQAVAVRCNCGKVNWNLVEQRNS